DRRRGSRHPCRRRVHPRRRARAAGPRGGRPVVRHGGLVQPRPRGDVHLGAALARVAAARLVRRGGSLPRTSRRSPLVVPPAAAHGRLIGLGALWYTCGSPTAGRDGLDRGRRRVPGRGSSTPFALHPARNPWPSMSAIALSTRITALP